MHRYLHKTTTDLPPALLYDAITAIQRWPEWDDTITAAVLKAPVFHGARFTVKPKAGFNRAMMIETADQPDRFVDVAMLVFARVRTARDFTLTNEGTVVSTVIEIWGPLAFLWDRLTARKQAARIHVLTERFLIFATAFSQRN